MAQVDKQDFWQQYDETQDLLEQALEKLVSKAEATPATKGLSGEFTEQVAMRMMDEAMESLATRYVQHLESFKMATDPLQILGHLEESEVLWRENAQVITRFDPNGEESSFIAQMRDLALSLFLEKLEEVSESTARNASAEQVACTIGIMAVVDHIWAEQGRPIADLERQQLRHIVSSFR